MTKVLDILDCTGAKVGDYELADGVLELEKGEQAVHDAVVSFLAAQRANTACTKCRGEINGGGAKPTRQKGLGRARTGSSRSPVWRGGGVVFGPTPERNYNRELNKKVFRLALRRAFSERVVDGSVIVLNAFDLPDCKTKNARKVLDALQVTRTAIVAVPDYEEKAVLATDNLAGVQLIKSASINVYDLVRYDKLVFTKDALDAFIGRLA